MNIPEYLKITNEDNMDLMSRYEDNYFDLAIVDPPYGLGDRLVDGGTKKNPMQKYRKDYESKRWDVKPKENYWLELFRVSKNQIIWGANYFLDHLGNTRGVICWDKMQMMPTMSRWEMAWTSFDMPAKTYECISRGKNRIHINEKPVALYTWLLQNYVKPNQKILDTHLGSGSIAIAIDQANKIEGMNLTLTACELDKDYYNDAMKRISAQCDWQPTFKPEQPKVEQIKLL